MRIQVKDQIDRMRRKKLTDVYDMSGSDEEGGSLDPPTIRKPGGKAGLEGRKESVKLAVLIDSWVNMPNSDSSLSNPAPAD